MEVASRAFTACRAVEDKELKGLTELGLKELQAPGSTGAVGDGDYGKPVGPAH